MEGPAGFAAEVDYGDAPAWDPLTPAERRIIRDGLLHYAPHVPEGWNKTAIFPGVMMALLLGVEALMVSKALWAGVAFVGLFVAVFALVFVFALRHDPVVEMVKVSSAGIERRIGTRSKPHSATWHLSDVAVIEFRMETEQRTIHRPRGRSYERTIQWSRIRCRMRDGRSVGIFATETPAAAPEVLRILSDMLPGVPVTRSGRPELAALTREPPGWQGAASREHAHPRRAQPPLERN